MSFPKARNFTGAYAIFIEYELLKHLDQRDLPFALRWLAAQPSPPQLDFHFERLADDIIVMAWGHMDSPAIFNAMVDTCIELLSDYRDLLGDSEKRAQNAADFDDVEKRRRLAKAIVERAANFRRIDIAIVSRWPRLLRTQDFPWIADEILSAPPGELERRWARLARYAFRRDSAGHLEILRNRISRSEEGRSEFEDVLRAQRPWPRLKRCLAEVCKSLRGRLAQCRRTGPRPSPRRRVRLCLKRFENGRNEYWRALVLEMTLEKMSKHYQNRFRASIVDLPGWKNSDERTRGRILAAAESYLRACEPFDPQHLYDRRASLSDAAAYKALLVLWKIQPRALDALPKEVWAHWVPVLLGPFGYGEHEEDHKELISRARHHVPERVAEVLREIMTRQVAEGHDVVALEKADELWDDRIARTVYALLPKARRSPTCWAELLAALVRHEHPGAWKAAVAELSLPLGPGEAERELAVQAATVIVQEKNDAAWPTVWPIIQADRNFGRRLLMGVAGGLHGNAKRIVSKLSEEAAADLFLWLAREFPYAGDPDHNGAYTPTGNDAARDLRNGLIASLENAGTLASCRAIERIAAAAPELDWLSSVLVEAKRNTMRRTWRPLQPSDLLQVAAQRGATMVTSPRQLQELLVEALISLEQALQGETPAAPDLWDQVDPTRGSEKFRPKDEGHFCDWVKRNLAAELGRRGIVIAREVEIRRGEGAAVGEETDIHVTAVVPGLTAEDTEQVRVIIEAKGCWNRELQTAMGTQLVGRYLKDNQCQHGIYVVGWYCCAHWDEDDYRQAKVPRWSIQDARKFFDHQADCVSTGTVAIRAVVLNTALR